LQDSKACAQSLRLGICLPRRFF